VRPILTPASDNAYVRSSGAQVSTPVEPGSLDVRAQVTLVAEVEPKP